MRLFSRLYDRVMAWAAHPKAGRYLAGLSFAESSFFPIPPDVMLAPMALARPERAWGFAALTTVASVVGGIFGYAIGYFAFEAVAPLLEQAGYSEAYAAVRDWFDRWGFWTIFVAGFSPVPYKLFTIAAGVTGMALIPFVAASVVARGARFFLVAALMVFGGRRMERKLRAYIDYIGWAIVVVAVVAYLVLRGGG